MANLLADLSELEGAVVLITGHTGFKGSWLCHLLTQFGVHVVGFALEAEPKSHFVASGTNKLVHSHLGDINDFDHLSRVMNECMPHLVIHMAAQPLVLESYRTPVATFQTNVIGTANVLQAAFECKSEPIVAVITSDKCYENLEKADAFNEGDRMGGADPYSSSKGCAELVAASYGSSFFLGNGRKLLTLRGGNVLGGGDWAKDRIMTDIVTSLAADKRPSIRSPNSIRPWQHILDVLNGYMSAILHVRRQSGAVFDSFNIGPLKGNVESVATLSECACSCWGGELVPEYLAETDEVHEARILKLNIDKALRLLNWAPLLSFTETVSLTVDWYRAFYAGEDARVITQEQIDRYFRKGEFNG